MTPERPSNERQQSIDSDQEKPSGETEQPGVNRAERPRGDTGTDDTGVSRRRTLLGAATVATTGIAGCSDFLGGGDDGDGSDGGDGEEDVPTGPETTDLTRSDCEPEVIDTNIQEDTTWSESECPRVALSGNVQVENEATVTIEAGVEVVGMEGSRLTVGAGSRLVVSGDPQNPVWFYGESEATGYWQGIRLRSDSANEIDNTIIEHGGHNDWANIYLDDNSQAAVTNVLSQQCATAGLVAESGTTLSAFETNEFRENEVAAVLVPTTLVGSLDGDSAYAGDNVDDVVHVFNANVENDATWPATDAPYRFSGNNHQIDSAAVTVEAGAEFLFEEGGRITVQQGSSFTAEGNDDAEIKFSGETAGVGFWQGIRVRSNNPNNSFDHVVAAHGGHNDWANIYLDDDSQASITNSTLRECSTSGLVAEAGTELAEFANNTLEENEVAAIQIPTTHIGSLDGSSTFAGENAEDVVLVFNANVENDATWPATDAPYLFSGNNHQIDSAAVTVEAGAEFLFGEGGRITVQQGSSFTAEGGGDGEITFEGETAAPGFWQGIRLRSNNPNNSFDNVVVAHGGNNGWANIYLDDSSRASVTNSTLRESATWGIYAENGTTLEYSGCTFENNAEGGVREPGE